MRWNKKITYKPKQYDIRTVAKFAWFPKEIGNKIVWLERYLSHQVFSADSDLYGAFCQWQETDRSLGKQIIIYNEARNEKTII